MFSVLRSLFPFIIALCTLSSIAAQETAFQKSLTNTEIKAFKDEMVFKYRLFFESVLNIIDNDNNIFSRRNAYYLINSLFDNEEANISDYLDNRHPETLPLKDYAQRLFMLENVLPLLDKRYKFSDSIYVQPNVKDINPKYNLLPKAKQKHKLFQVYTGEVFFIEEIISVQKVRKDIFDAVDRNVVKKLSFKISHDQDDSYRLYITSIGILDPRNRAYDYRAIKTEIRSSSQTWSDSADPQYLKEIKEEAQARGITLVGEKKPNEYTFSQNKNSWYYDSPTFWDYALPGYGHLRFGSDKVRYRDAIIHGATTFGLAGLSYHYNQKSHKFYRQYQQSSSTELANNHLEKSNDLNTRSKILAVGAVASYVVDIMHLISKNNKQKKLINKVIGSTDVQVTNDLSGYYAQFSLSVMF